MTTSANRTPATSRPTAPPPHAAGTGQHRRAGEVLILMSVCAALMQAMAAAVNLSVPALARSGLHPSPTALVWIVDAYLITFACMLIPGGALADRFGRKGVLLTGLGLFAAGCLLAGAASGAPVLIAARAVCGAGAALALPVTLGKPMLLFAPQNRSRVVATWTAALAIGGILGNTVGGVVLEYLPWQGLFVVFGAAGALVLVLSALRVPTTARREVPLDPVGSGLLAAAVVALLYGLIEGRVLGWDSPAVLGAFALCVVLAVRFVRSGLRRAHPLIDPRLFAIRRLRAGSVGVALAFFGSFAMFYVNAQYLTLAHGYSMMRAGVAIAPIAVFMACGSRLAPRVVAVLGSAGTVAVGFALQVAGLAGFSLVGPSTHYALYLVCPSVAMLGMGLALPPLSGAIMSSLPPESAGTGSGINGAAREIGSAVGIAVMGTALGGRGAGQGSSSAALAHAMDSGFRIVALVVALLAVPVVAWSRERARG
jgi:EmrB/QacA subfamily drug resistance transporter